MFRKSWRAWPVLIALGAVLQADAARAQAKPSTVDSDIKTLLQLTGTDKLATQMAGYMVNNAVEMMKRNNPQMSDEALATAKNEIQKLMAERMPALMDQIVPIYAKHFSPEDIKGLISFYRSPLGAKSIRETPLILQETTKVGEEWGRSLGPELERRLQKAFEKPGTPKQGTKR